MELNLINVCRIVEFQKDYVFGPHKHSRLEVNFIISGKAIIKINNDITAYGSSECMIVYPLVDHYFEAESKIKMLQIEFQQEVFSNFVTDYSINCFDLNEQFPDSSCGYAKIDNAHFIYRCLERIYQEVNLNKLFKEELLATYFQELLLLIKRRLNEQKQQYEKTISSVHLQQAIKHIVNNYHNQIIIEDLATQLSISSRYLRQLYVKELGVSVSTYILEFRLSKAKEFFQQNKYTIAEIAYKSGFSSPQYFSKVFFKKNGITPSEYLVRLFRNV